MFVSGDSTLLLLFSAGQTVALVGASGCGKSTIFSLIERFYQRDSGEILIDQSLLETVEVFHLRGNIGLVAQEPQLFSMTIRENITYGLVPEPPISAVRAAAQRANVLEFADGFEDGLETEVGGKGGKLSGGQRQRVAIARALLRQEHMKLLLLDEATSALDSASEAKVQRALDSSAEGRTTLVIAHRLSTVQHADQILVFDAGRIIERGTHTDLMAREGAYAKMARATDEGADALTVHDMIEDT